MPVDPDTQITVCCGSTEAMIATMMAIVDPGDEVIVFEPFYENYGPDAILSGATPRFVRLHRRPTGRRTGAFDPDELAAAFTNRTRAIIINTPNNPTGKVFTRDELAEIARLCQQWDVIAVTDEIYEHILYDGATHVPMASLDGMADRTVTINSVSKTFSVTGWRVGWAVAPPDIAGGDPQGARLPDGRRGGAAAGRRRGRARAAGDYYRELADGYRGRRDRLLAILEGAGFVVLQAARRVLHHDGHRRRSAFADDVAFARHLVTDIGVAARAGQQLLPRSGRRPHARAVLFLQEGRDAGGGGEAARNALRTGRRSAGLYVRRM